MLFRLLSAAAVGAGLLAPGVSQAAIITYTFSANLTGSTGPDAALFVPSVTGRFGFDTSGPDGDPSPNSASYVGAAGNFALDGLVSLPAFGPPQIDSVVSVLDGATDSLTWGALYDIGGGAQFAAVFEINGTSSLLSSDALPAALPVDQISSAVLTLVLVADGTSFASYQLTSLALTEVPEPIGMFGAALLGLVGLTRTRRIPT